jgi:hypothetical protein
MMMYGREIATNAAREGARAGIVQGPPKRSAGEILTIVDTYLTGTGVNPADVDLVPTGAGLTNPATLTVSGTYNYSFLVPVIPALVGIPNPLLIPISVVMRHE